MARAALDWVLCWLQFGILTVEQKMWRTDHFPCFEKFYIIIYHRFLFNVTNSSVAHLLLIFIRQLESEFFSNSELSPLSIIS